MKKIALSVYGFNIQDCENTRSELHNIGGNTFLDIINSFMQQHNGDYMNDDIAEKIFKSDECHTYQHMDNENNEIYTCIIGTIKTGEYGVESEIVNSHTGQTVYTKSEDDADVLPFYFCIAIPAGKTDRGIILLQTLGIHGMKTVFQKKIQDHIKTYKNDLRLIIGNIVPRTYIDRYLRTGVLQKIRMIKYDVPHDLSERIGINNGVETTYQELTIHKPIGFIQRKMGLIGECINGQRRCNSIIEIEDFEYDDLKLEVKMGKSTKTFKLSNIDNVIVSEDITDDVNTEGGIPTTESIKPILIDTATDYLKEMGLIE